MRGAQSLARDLPCPNRVVAHENAFAPALENDVAALRALFPDGVREITVHFHVVVFHRAHAEKIIQRQIVKVRDVENVGSQPQRLVMSERLRRAAALADHAPVGLRFENKKFRKRGKKLKRRKRFQLLFGWNVVGVLEHAALLLRESQVLLRPRNEFVAIDQTARFHSVEARDGGELIVFDKDKNSVGGAFAAVVRSQEDFRCVVWITPAEIFVTKKRLQLVVERSNFRASNLVRERNGNTPALNLRSEMAMMRGDAHVARPEAICSPGS